MHVSAFLPNVFGRCLSINNECKMQDVTQCHISWKCVAKKPWMRLYSCEIIKRSLHKWWRQFWPNIHSSRSTRLKSRYKDNVMQYMHTVSLRSSSLQKQKQQQQHIHCEQKTENRAVKWIGGEHSHSTAAQLKLSLKLNRTGSKKFH